MIEAELPDGTILEFPDGTDQAVIQRVVKQRLGLTQTEPQQEVLTKPDVGLGMDVIQSAGSGLLRGAVGTAQLPEMAGRGLLRLGQEGLQALGYEKALGMDISEDLPVLDTATGRAARQALGAVPYAEEFLEYEPQTGLGKFIGTASEFVGGAGAVGLTGKVARKAAERVAKKGAVEPNKMQKIGKALEKSGLSKEAQAAAIVAGVGSEAAGQAAEETEFEGAARIAGAIASPTVAARSFNLLAKPYDVFAKPKQIYNQVKTGNEAVDLTLSRAIAKPTAKNQRIFKTTAYNEVDKLGDIFSADDLIGLAENTRAKLYQGVAGNKLDITPQGKLRGEGHIKSALDILDEYTDAPSSLSNLDNMRQRIRAVWKSGEDGVKKQDPRIKEILNDIDKLIVAKTDGSEILKAARLGHIRTRKLEILEDALDAADREVKAGASITKRYQAALKKISTQKASRSYFSDKEIEAMDRILEGQMDDKILRQFGKISPFNGINLMNVLTNVSLGAAAVAGSPAILGVTAGSIIAKPISDAVIKSQIRELNRFLATGAAPTKFRPPMPARALGLAPQIPQEQ
tara:strand:- start:36 stop:1751 length:1716 start_codon:yes stop_codon:yes gene_type:complete